MLKHIIPIGTHVTFEGEPRVHVVDQYTNLIGPCPPDCPHDHDCFDEPYINVRVQHWAAFPLSKLRQIFDQPRNFGRTPTEEEMKGHGG